MKQSIFGALILTMFLLNVFAWAGWFESDGQMRSWRSVAIEADWILLEQEQALRGNADMIDRCFQHGI